MQKERQALTKMLMEATSPGTNVVAFAPDQLEAKREKNVQDYLDTFFVDEGLGKKQDQFQRL